MHLGGGDIIFELIKWRPGDVKARQQYPLPEPPPYIRQRVVLHSGGWYHQLEVGVVQFKYGPIYRLEVEGAKILRRCGIDATLGAIQWWRSCAKRVKVEVGCGVEGPGSRDAAPPKAYDGMSERSIEVEGVYWSGRSGAEQVAIASDLARWKGVCTL